MRLLNHYSFGLPAAIRFLTEDDGGGGGGTSTATESSSLDSFEAPPDTTDMERGRTQERVEGEKAPDFSSLGGRKPAPKTEEGGEAPSGDEKPPESTPTKQAAPKKEVQKTPESAKKEPEAKKPAEKKLEAKKEADAPAKETAAKEEEAKIPTDAEIDALQPRADSSKETKENFKRARNSMKSMAQVIKEERAAKEALIKEVETLKQSTGKLPPEVETKLKAAEHFQLLFDAQNSPQFRQEYDGKIEASTEAVYAMLAQHGLKEDVIKQIKAVAEKNGGDIEKWPHWAALINKFTDPLAKQDAINAINNRRQAVKAKADKLNMLATDRDAYLKEMETKDAAEKAAWAKQLEEHTLNFSNDFEPAMEKEIPENATPEVKKAIEAHNAQVAKVAEEFKTNVLAAYNRDPKFIAEMAFANVKSKHFEKELTSVKAQLEKANAKAAELEDKISKIKSAGRIAHVESPSSSTGKATTEEDGKIGGDGASAVRNFFNKKQGA